LVGLGILVVALEVFQFLLRAKLNFLDVHFELVFSFSFLKRAHVQENIEQIGEISPLQSFKMVLESIEVNTYPTPETLLLFVRIYRVLRVFAKSFQSIFIISLGILAFLFKFG
jgi:hypothetical protein